MKRCPSRGGSDARGGNFRCGLPAGHDGSHSALTPTGAAYEPDADALFGPMDCDTCERYRARGDRTEHLLPCPKHPNEIAAGWGHLPCDCGLRPCPEHFP